jgi:hypothetical protein
MVAKAARWPGLQGVVIVVSERFIDAKLQYEMRLYLTSLVLLANLVGPMIRNHGAIENSLHWVMDMMFRDDECRIRTENAPANFTTLRHIGQNLYRKSPAKDSMRLKRKAAAWDDEYPASLIAA